MSARKIAFIDAEDGTGVVVEPLRVGARMEVRAYCVNDDSNVAYRREYAVLTAEQVDALVGALLDAIDQSQKACGRMPAKQEAAE